MTPNELREWADANDTATHDDGFMRYAELLGIASAVAELGATRAEYLREQAERMDAAPTCRYAGRDWTRAEAMDLMEATVNSGQQLTILGLGQRHWLAMPPRLTEDADFLKGDTPWAALCDAVAQMEEDTNG